MTVKELRDRLNGIIALGVVEGQEWHGHPEAFEVYTRQLHCDSGHYGAREIVDKTATEVEVEYGEVYIG